MDYIDTDVLIHSLVNQNPNLNLIVNDMLEKMFTNKRLVVSWLGVQEAGFVLAKLNQQTSFISSKLESLISLSPVQYESANFTRAIKLAENIGFKDFNDCLHTAIAEQHCTDLYTCNYKDFKRIQPFTSLNIHFL